ncbi:MAG: Fic family protein [Nanoarchaeota archaeon]|nr:Fic family protein [Nanoarchaeota archaeon]
MVYTEVQQRNGKKYYYRVRSIRKGDKVEKIREYLGVNLSPADKRKKEDEADKLLGLLLSSLLSDKETRTLKDLKHNFKKLGKTNFVNRYESFLARFTYDSNAIEGNTLTLQETSFILFEHRTPSGKSLREINEVLNHHKAFDYMLTYAGDITKIFMCELQRLIVANTLKSDLEKEMGKYRSLQVFIRGANFVPPPPSLVGSEMRKLLLWYGKHKDKLHPLIVAAYVHAAFESIHPFVDGNGRTGRLLINFILHKHGFPMVNIPKIKRLAYYECIEKARLGDLRLFVKFLLDLLVEQDLLV